MRLLGEPRALFLVVLLAACGASPSAITVTLPTSSFATSGGNVFNCTTPDMPPDRTRLRNEAIGCTPARNADGSWSKTPVTVFDELGCSDDHGALVVVTCAGGDGPGEVTGTVTISITSSCGQKTSQADNAQSFTYTNLAAGATTSQSLATCATFTNFCPTSNACGFNALSATVEVAGTPPSSM